jgi:predicted chitinase
MKAKEFVVERRRKKKVKNAAYGPGPFGMYGTAGGYSGGSGVAGSGSGGAVGEASYPGNIGMMEVAKFFQTANDRQKQIFKKLLEKNKLGLAWKLIQDVTGTRLQGQEFNTTEGWKDTLTGLGIAGAIGLGSVGAMNARQALSPDVEKAKVTQTDQQSGQRVSGKVVDAPKVKQEPVNVSGTSEELILKKAARAAGIEGTELAALLAQAAHETMNFQRMVEFGGAKTFNRYDPRFAPNRAKILGNVKAGDGERYKGRGYIQITGRYNYRRAGEALSLPLEQKPELAEDLEVAAKIAVWYWKRRVQPRVSDFTDVEAVTKPINPALRGLADRENKFQSYKVAFK